MADITLNDKFSDTLKKYAKGMEDMSKQTETASQSVQKYAGRVAFASTMLSKFAPQLANMEAVNKFVAKNNDAIKMGASVMGHFNDKIKEMAKEIEPLALIMPEIDPLFKTMKAGQITLDKITDSVTQVADKTVESYDYADKTQGVLSKLKVPIALVATIGAVAGGIWGIEKALHAVALHADTIEEKVLTPLSNFPKKVSGAKNAVAGKIGSGVSAVKGFDYKGVAKGGWEKIKVYATMVKDLAVIGNDALRDKFIYYDILCSVIGKYYNTIKENISVLWGFLKLFYIDRYKEVAKETAFRIKESIAARVWAIKDYAAVKWTALRTSAAVIGGRVLEWAVSTKLFKKLTKTWTDGERERLLNTITFRQKVAKFEDGVVHITEQRQLRLWKLKEAFDNYREAKAKEVALVEVGAITFKQRAEARADAFTKWRMRMTSVRSLAHHAIDYIWMRTFYKKKEMVFDEYVEHCKGKMNELKDNARQVANNIAGAAVAGGKAAGAFYSHGLKGQINEVFKTLKSIPSLIKNVFIAMAGFTILSETASKLIDVTKGLEALKNKIDEVSEKFEFMAKKARRAFVFGGEEEAGTFTRFARKMSAETGLAVGEIIQQGEKLRHLGVGEDNIEEILRLSHRMSSLAPNMDFSGVSEQFWSAIQSGSAEGMAGIFGGGAGVERKLRRTIRRKFARGDIAGGLEGFKKVADFYGYTEEKANKVNDNIYTKLQKVSNMVGQMVTQIRTIFATKLEPIIEHAIEYLNSDGFKAGFEKYKRMLIAAMDAIGHVYEFVKPIVHNLIDLIWAPPNEAGDSTFRQIVRFGAHVIMLGRALTLVVAPISAMLASGTLLNRMFGFVGFGIRGVIAGFAKFGVELKDATKQAAKSKDEVDKKMGKSTDFNWPESKLTKFKNSVVHAFKVVGENIKTLPRKTKNTLGNMWSNRPTKIWADKIHSNLVKVGSWLVESAKAAKETRKKVRAASGFMMAGIKQDAKSMRLGFHLAMSSMRKDLARLPEGGRFGMLKTGMGMIAKSALHMTKTFVKQSGIIMKIAAREFASHHPKITAAVKAAGNGAIRVAKKAARSVRIIGTAMKVVAKGIGRSFKTMAGFLLDPFTIIPIAVTILGKLGQKFARQEGKGEVSFVQGLIHIIVTGLVRVFAFIKNKLIDLKFKIKDGITYVKNFWISMWNSIADILEDNPILQKMGVTKGGMHVKLDLTSEQEAKAQFQDSLDTQMKIAETAADAVEWLGKKAMNAIQDFDANKFIDRSVEYDKANFDANNAARSNVTGFSFIKSGQVTNAQKEYSGYSDLVSKSNNPILSLLMNKDQMNNLGFSIFAKAQDAKNAIIKKSVESQLRQFAEYQKDPEAYKKKLAGAINEEEQLAMIKSIEDKVTGGFEKVYQGLKDFFGENELKELLDMVGINVDATKKAGDDTGKIRQAMSHEQDLRWMKEMAEQRFVNRVNVRQLTPTVNVQVKSQASAQDIGAAVKRTLEEESARSAGVYYGNAG